MIEIAYRTSFIRQFGALETALQTEVLEKIALFRYKKNHCQLKVHKLHGPLKNCLSFSVNYKIRIVFEYLSKNEVAMLTIGDHKIYQ